LVRIEEADKYKAKMEEYREELERIHQERLNKLRAREKETIDKCNERLRFIEAANHDHRQKILKDFEMLKMREDDLDRNRALFEEVFYSFAPNFLFFIKRAQN
jgi:oral-facial-digital syndrome 1 protein